MLVAASLLEGSQRLSVTAATHPLMTAATIAFALGLVAIVAAVILGRRARSRSIDIECPACRSSIQVKHSMSLLGFRHFTCPECDRRTMLPLLRSYAIAYTCWLVTCILAYSSFIARDELPPFLGVLFLGVVAFALAENALLVAGLRRARASPSDRPRRTHRVHVGRAFLEARQDGPRERQLEEELTQLFRGETSIGRAYLCRIADRRPDGAGVVLCIPGPEDQPLESMASRVCERIFGDGQIMDTLFLSETEEGRVRSVCKPFYDVERMAQS
jgi:hypothetical protein